MTTKPKSEISPANPRADVKTEHTPPAVADESSALISLIDRAARDPNVDIEKMERLFQLHERATNKRAEMAYNTDMAAAQSEIQPVVRTLINTQTQKKYADLAAIADKAMPVANKHGLGFSFSEFTSTQPNCLGVRCEVTHAEGFSKIYDFNIPLDAAGLKGAANKTATHAYGSTFTYGRRYATCGVLNIATKDDTDGNTPNAVITDEQAEEIRTLIADTESDIDQFLKVAKAESIADIRGDQFQRLHGLLLTKKKKAEKNENN